MTCSECKRPFTALRCLDPFRILCEECEKAQTVGVLASFIVILIAVFLGVVWLTN